jgi:phosphate transport system substrate-binding protein
MSRIARWLSIVLVAGLALGSVGCSRKPRLNGAGATFVFPVMSKWAAEYDKAKGVEINYQSIGSGGGIQQMTAKTADFGCSDAFLNEEQLKKAKDTNGDVVHIPLVMGAVVPIYNLEGVDELTFDGPALADIFLGKIKKWNDKALVALNPKAKLPDKDIGVVHRSDGSGTTNIFADYLSKVSPEWKEKVGVGTSLKWPTGEGASGNPGVAGRVKTTAGTIGYVELIYALQNDIKCGLVKNKEGVAVKADLKSVTAAADNMLKDIPDDLRYSITDAGGKDSYPISGTSWAVVYTKQPAGTGKQIVDFLNWCTHDGQQYCEALHYAKLPPGLVERVEKKLALIEAK